ncbi:MAG TPA: hypothetical protein VMH33_11755 [Solirubrobacterales bacterium]|nr:hypothetical protein [Solirubrobacterales bacterium]
MFMAVWIFLALAVTTLIYAWLGQGGGVSGLIFFGIMLMAVIIKGVLRFVHGAPAAERPPA